VADYERFEPTLTRFDGAFACARDVFASDETSVGAATEALVAGTNAVAYRTHRPRRSSPSNADAKRCPLPRRKTAQGPAWSPLR